MELEWNTAKAALNLQKHGVSFEDAARVFLDNGRLETYDGREDYGEDRWATIGQVYTVVLYVVYTIWHEDTVRLISARRALSYEQKQYTMKLTLDLNNPPFLTDEQKVRLTTLAALPDNQIDTSDAPLRLDAVWVKAVDFPHRKKLISLRIDEDVLNFFRHTGKRYQTRINAVLRSYMEAHKAHAK